MAVSVSVVLFAYGGVALAGECFDAQLGFDGRVAGCPQCRRVHPDQPVGGGADHVGEVLVDRFYRPGDIGEDHTQR